MAGLMLGQLCSCAEQLVLIISLLRSGLVSEVSCQTRADAGNGS